MEVQKITIQQVKENPALIDRFTEQNFSLVWSVVRKFFRGVINTPNADDYFQVGCIGLLKAVNRFNNNFDVAFSTYAVPKILGEIKRYRRDYESSTITISRTHKEKFSKWQRLHDEGLSDEEICDKLKVTQDELDESILAMRAIVSLNDECGEKDNGTPRTFEGIISDDYDLEDSVSSRLDVQKVIDNLDTINKTIICLRMEDMTQADISKIVGMSQVQVSRRLKFIENIFSVGLDGGQEELNCRKTKMVRYKRSKAKAI